MVQNNSGPRCAESPIPERSGERRKKEREVGRSKRNSSERRRWWGSGSLKGRETDDLNIWSDRRCTAGARGWCLGRTKRSRGGLKNGLGGALASIGFAELNGGDEGGNRCGGWRIRGSIWANHNLVKILPA